MSTIAEKITMCDRARSDKGWLLLFRAGMFYQAFERDAMAFCNTIKPAKVIAMWSKQMKCYICRIGFPVSGVDKWLEGREVIKVKEGDEAVIAVELSEKEWLSTPSEDLPDWKEQHVIAAKNSKRQKLPIMGKDGEPKEMVRLGDLFSKPEQAILRIMATGDPANMPPQDCQRFLRGIWLTLKEMYAYTPEIKPKTKKEE